MSMQNVILISIILVLAVIIYRYIVLPPDTISTLMSAKVLQSVPKNVMPGAQSSVNSFSYSIWMFVDNWNYKYGAPKPIFGTFSNTNAATKKLALPFVCLGEYSNELDVYMDIADRSGGAPGFGSSQTNGAEITGMPVAASDAGVISASSTTVTPSSIDESESEDESEDEDEGEGESESESEDEAETSTTVVPVRRTSTPAAVVPVRRTSTPAAVVPVRRTSTPAAVVPVRRTSTPAITSATTSAITSATTTPEVAPASTGVSSGGSSGRRRRRRRRGRGPFGRRRRRRGRGRGREGLENPSGNSCSTINETTQTFDKYCEANGYKRIKCVVPNIPLQKWVNVIVSVYQQSVDIYIDGKLVKTCLLYGIPNVDMTKSETSITPYGGFSGWTTMFKYWEAPCDPQKAWDIYSAGYSGTWMGNLLGNYSIKVSIVDNATQTAIV